jgi:hypothetical protein
VNREINRERFQEPLKVKRSETFKSGKEVLLIGRRLGEKKWQSGNPRGVPNRKSG